MATVAFAWAMLKLVLGQCMKIWIRPDLKLIWLIDLMSNAAFAVLQKFEGFGAGFVVDEGNQRLIHFD
jgi:hypothetical protein